MSAWVRLPLDEEQPLVYYRRDFQDGTWLAVSKEDGKETWRWVHYGPTQYHVRDAGLGLRSRTAAKRAADDYMNSPEQQAILNEWHPTEGL